MTNSPPKLLLLTGGTGTLGHALVQHLLMKWPVTVIRIFSRDEFKQWEMQELPWPGKERLQFRLGDVRDAHSLLQAAEGVDCILHAAALKQVPRAEQEPYGYIQTNVLGTKNVVNAALHHKTPRTLLFSTDKAVEPCNLYGATKMCAERLLLAANTPLSRFSVLRYGNVLGSRGGILNLWQQCMQKNQPLPVTDEEMTRFWVTPQAIAELVPTLLDHMQGQEIFIPKAPSVKIGDLVRGLWPEAPIVKIPIRSGEKMHETLVGGHETRLCTDKKNFYLLDYKRSTHQEGQEKGALTYSSDRNTEWLSAEQVREMATEIWPMAHNAALCK